MPTREQFVAEALAWVGTPFRPNQSAKQLGADCIGVIAGIALACGVPVRYRRDYDLQPDGSLRRELEAQLERRHGDPQPGDVLLMSFEGEPHHVALYIGDEIVHAYVQVRRCVRQPYTEQWRALVRGVYSFPGVE